MTATEPCPRCCTATAAFAAEQARCVAEVDRLQAENDHLRAELDRLRAAASEPGEGRYVVAWRSLDGTAGDLWNANLYRSVADAQYVIDDEELGDSRAVYALVPAAPDEAALPPATRLLMVAEWLDSAAAYQDRSGAMGEHQENAAVLRDVACAVATFHEREDAARVVEMEAVLREFMEEDRAWYAASDELRARVRAVAAALGVAVEEAHDA